MSRHISYCFDDPPLSHSPISPLLIFPISFLGRHYPVLLLSQMENDDLQRTMDLLPLVCLSFNVMVLVFAFSEHFSFLFNPCKKFLTDLQSSFTIVLLGWFSGSSISEYSSQESSISKLPGSLDVLRRYCMEIYQTTVTTLTRAIVIAAAS